MTLVSYNFFGLRISLFSKNTLRDEIISTIINKERKVFFGYSFGYFPFIKKTPELYTIANRFDVMVTDGRLFYLVAKLFGAPLKYDISIPNLSKLIFEIANEKRYSIMLIGSTHETNKLATLNLRKKFPNAIVYDGYFGGKFDKSEYPQINNRINKVKPDILMVGVSSPKKEFFVSRNKDKLDSYIIVPFGGMIDSLGGKVKPTPGIIKYFGFAAFYRLFQEPKRLAKVTLLSIFETFFRILPTLIWQVVVRRNKNFFITSIYTKLSILYIAFNNPNQNYLIEFIK